MSARRAKAAEAEKESSERWLLTYADLITLLLAFFIVLWSIGQADIKKFDAIRNSLAKAFNVGIGDATEGTSPIFDGGSNFDPQPFGAVANDLAQIEQEFDKFAEKNGLTEKIKIRSDKDQIVISLADNLLFDSASATLKPEAFFVLDEAAKIIASLDNQIRVEGHTDSIALNTGEFASNWELSSARATEVLRYLVDEGGINPDRIFAAGYAEYRPVENNNTPEGRAANRRADIVIMYPPDETDPTLPATPTVGP